jgi:hypothetical protein
LPLDPIPAGLEGEPVCRFQVDESDGHAAMRNHTTEAPRITSAVTKAAMMR